MSTKTTQHRRPSAALAAAQAAFDKAQEDYDRARADERPRTEVAKAFDDLVAASNAFREAEASEPEPEPEIVIPEEAIPAEPERLFDRLFDEIRFETTIWTGKKHIRNLKAMFDDQVVEEDRVHSPQVELLPEDLARDGDQARRAIYYVLDAYTMPCDVKGTRIVSRTRSAEFARRFMEAVDNFKETADKIAREYPRILSHNEGYWLNRFFGGDRVKYQETIGRHIPGSPDQLRSHFSVYWTLAKPRSSAIGYEAEALRSFFEIASRNGQAQAEEMVRALVEGPAAKLSAALFALQGRLSSGTVITPESFTAVGDAISLCLACGDALSPEFRSTIAGVRDSIRAVMTEAGELRENGVSYTQAFRNRAGTLNAAFDAAIQAANNRLDQAAMLEKFGVDYRPMDFGEASDAPQHERAVPPGR